VYFDVRGRAEVARLIMEELGITYTDTKVNRDDMKVLKTTGDLAFGQVPLLKHGSLKLVQSNSIIRYLGRKNNRYGSSAEERAHIDVALDGAEDIRLRYLNLIYAEKLNDAAKTKHLEEVAKPWLGFMEAMLAKNDGGKGFLVGNQISIADFSVYEELDKTSRIFPDILSQYPLLKGFKQRIELIPRIAAYLQSGRRPAAVNGNGMG